MTYLNKFLYYVKLYCQYYPVYFTLFIFVFLELLIIKSLIFNKKKYKDLKLENKYINIIYIYFYIFIFIGLILMLRYFRWNYTFNLIAFFTNIYKFYEQLPLILFINFILILIILVLILKYIKNLFHREILKSFIYYYHYYLQKDLENFVKNNPDKNPRSDMTKKDHHFFVYFYDKILPVWNYKRLADKILLFLIQKPLIKYVNKKWYKYLPHRTFDKFLKNLPLIILITLVIYDCIINTLNIHLIFYYLPFYFILSSWENVASFKENTNSVINYILHDIYYTPNIKFIDVTKEEQEYLELYINRNCKCISLDIYDKDIFIQAEKRDLVAFFGIIFRKNRSYVRQENTNIFVNSKIGDAFEFTSEEIEKNQKIYFIE